MKKTIGVLSTETNVVARCIVTNEVSYRPTRYEHNLYVYPIVTYVLLFLVAGLGRLMETQASISQSLKDAHWGAVKWNARKAVTRST